MMHSVFSLVLMATVQCVNLLFYQLLCNITRHAMI